MRSLRFPGRAVGICVICVICGQSALICVICLCLMVGYGSSVSLCLGGGSCAAVREVLLVPRR